MTHGYVHSWALRWMLRHHQQARDALLGLLVHDAPAPWHVGKDDIQLEHRVGRHRADLRVEAADANRRAVTILIETKVNDEVSDSQIEAYFSGPAEVVLYGPGLTGLLHDGNDPLDRERWVTGRQVINALAEVDVPDLLRGYLDEVGAQASRRLPW